MTTRLPSPDLSDAAILRAVCALRPCRTGGLRLERDESDLGDTPLIHNYGHGGCGVTLGFGTAEVAADLVEANTRAPSHTLVLGGGVVALTTALELLTRGHRVTMLAQAYATDTTSNIAGALWLPTGIDFPDPGAKRDAFNAILRRAFSRFTALEEPGEQWGGRWGVERLPVYEPASAPHFPEFFESGAIDPPRDIDELPVGAARTRGRVFETLFIHTPRFLNVLRGEVESRGGRLLGAAFASRDDIARAATEHQADAVVNCLALASRELFDDPAVYPARGVLVHARPAPLGYIYHDGYTYMFPRSDALVLGGCFIPNDTNPEPDDATVEAILARHRAVHGQNSPVVSP
ncbi:MAG: FAD-dependent oxidoreductase [Phycisphaerales bacterium JB040]